MRIVHLGRGALRPIIAYPGCILICVPQCFVSVKPGRDLVLITAYTAEEGRRGGEGGAPFRLKEYLFQLLGTCISKGGDFTH